MTTLYQHNITFLPRPPRNIFSHGNEATRFRIPDFTSVAELRQHTTRLLILRAVVPTYWPQMVVGASIVSVLLIVIALIIVRRMCEQSFWLVRIMRRPTGIVIVPNTLLAFTLCEGVFAVVYVAFCWVYRSWFDVHTRLPHGYFVWILLMWLPLFAGPFVALHGTYFAIPSALPKAQLGGGGGGGETDEGSEGVSGPSWCKRIASHSVVINFLPVAVLLVVIVTIVTPTMIANKFQTRALQRQQDWLSRFAGQTAFTDEMVQESQQVWFDLGHSAYVASIVFALWSAYAFVLGAAYMRVTMRLLTTLRAELSKSESADAQLSMVVTQFVISEGQSMSAVSRQEDEDVLRAIGLDTQTGRSTRQLELKNSRGSSGTDGGVIVVGSSMSHPTDYGRRSATAYRGRFAWLRKFLPNIVAQTAAHPHFRRAPPSQRSELRDLRKAYRHHLVQAVAIAPGCVIFSALAFWSSVILSTSIEQPNPDGGTQVEGPNCQVFIAVTWAIVVLGSITLLAIAQRTYEPVLSSRKWYPSGGPRAERKGRVQLEQVHSFFLPSASQAMAARLGECLSTYDTRMTQTDSIQALPKGCAPESTSAKSFPLRNMPSSATMIEQSR